MNLDCSRIFLQLREGWGGETERGEGDLERKRAQLKIPPKIIIYQTIGKVKELF